MSISIPAGTEAYDDGLTPRSVYASLVSECCLTGCMGPSSTLCNSNSTFYSSAFLLLPNSTSFSMQCCDGSYAPTVSRCHTCTGSAPTHYTAIIGAVLAGVFGSIVLFTVYLVWKRRREASVARHKAGIKLNDARMTIRVPGGAGGVLPLRFDDDVSPLPSGGRKKKEKKSSVAEVEIHIDGHTTPPVDLPAASAPIPTHTAPEEAEAPVPPRSPRTPRGQIPVFRLPHVAAASVPVPAVSGEVAQQMGIAPAVPPLSFGTLLGGVPDASPEGSPKSSPTHSQKTSARRPHLSPAVASRSPLTSVRSTSRTAAERTLEQGREAAAAESHSAREKQPEKRLRKGKGSRREHGRDEEEAAAAEEEQKKEKVSPRRRSPSTPPNEVDDGGGDEVEEKER